MGGRKKRRAKKTRLISGFFITLLLGYDDASGCAIAFVTHNRGGQRVTTNGKATVFENIGAAS